MLEKIAKPEYWILASGSGSDLESENGIFASDLYSVKLTGALWESSLQAGRPDPAVLPFDPRRRGEAREGFEVLCALVLLGGEVQDAIWINTNRKQVELKSHSKLYWAL